MRFDVPLHDVPIVVSGDDLLVEGAPHEGRYLTNHIGIRCQERILMNKYGFVALNLRSLRRNGDGHDRLIGVESPRIDYVDDTGVPHLLVRAKGDHLSGVGKGAGPHRRLGVDAALHLALGKEFYGLNKSYVLIRKERMKITYRCQRPKCERNCLRSPTGSWQFPSRRRDTRLHRRASWSLARGKSRTCPNAPH